RSLNSLVIHSNATAADSGGGTMCAHRSFLGAACAKTGARPVARMPTRPAPVRNVLRRGLGAGELLIVIRFPPRCTSFFAGLADGMSRPRTRLSTCMVHTVPEDCHGPMLATCSPYTDCSQPSAKRCC